MTLQKAKLKIPKTRTHVQLIHRIWKNFYKLRNRWDQMKKCQWPTHAGYTWIHGVLALHFPPPPLTPRYPKCAPTRSRAAGIPPTQCSHDSPSLPLVPLPAPPLWNFSVSEHLETAPHRILRQEVGQAWPWGLFCTQSKVGKGGQGLVMLAIGAWGPEPGRSLAVLYSTLFASVWAKVRKILPNRLSLHKC